MNTVFRVWLLFFVIVFTQLTNAAEVHLTEEEKLFLQQHPVVRVHNETDWPPFNYAEEGRPLGFSIDYMNLVAKNTGFQVEYVTGPSWNEFLGMMKDGSLDVMLNIVKTPERLQYLLYTPPYADNPNAILSKKDKPYKSIESLFGKTVALPKGFFTEEIIRKNYPEIKLLPVRDMFESMKAVTFGKADAALGELAVFNHLLSAHLMSDLAISGEAIMGNPEYSLLNIATRKDLPILASILTKGVESITREEVKQLQNKWLLQAPKIDRVRLSQDEEEFVNSHPVLRVHNETNWPPFNYVENNVPTGYSIDYMNLVAKNTGIQVEYVTGPSWNEFLEMMKNGSLDVMLNIVKTPERMQYLLYTPPYADNPNAILSKKDTPYNTVESLFGKTVALPKGFFTEEVLRKNFPEIKLLPMEDMLESMKAVSFGKADAALGELAVFNHLLNAHMMSDLVVSGEAIMGDPEYSLLNIATRKDLPVLASILTKGVESVTREEKKELQNKWLLKTYEAEKLKLTDQEKDYLQHKKSIRVCVNQNWMPFESMGDSQEYTGIGSDVVDMVFGYVDKPIELISTKNWLQTTGFIKNNKCDILPMAAYDKSRLEFIDFTKPYVTESVVIATKEDRFFVQGSKDLTDKKVGVLNDSYLVKSLGMNNPHVDIVTVSDAEDGLEKVRSGELFGYVDALPSIAYVIQENGLFDLKIAGRLEFDVELSVASRKDEPLLNSIMQKALDEIGAEQIRTIEGKWIAIKVEQSFDYRKLFYVVFVFLIIFAIIFYKNRSIKRINAQLEMSHKEVEEKNRLLEKLAITDSLTKLYNRNWLDEVLVCESNRSNRFPINFGVILMDVDHFKCVNDIHGHQVGDVVLQEFADILKSNSRNTDVVGRWGGEEFLIICGETTMDELVVFAEKLRKEIASRSFTLGEQQTASFGVSVYVKDESVSSLLKRADDALYKAKENGRNRVEYL